MPHFLTPASKRPDPFDAHQRDPFDVPSGESCPRRNPLTASERLPPLLKFGLTVSCVNLMSRGFIRPTPLFGALSYGSQVKA